MNSGTSGQQRQDTAPRQEKKAKASFHSSPFHKQPLTGNQQGLAPAFALNRDGASRFAATPPNPMDFHEAPDSFKKHATEAQIVASLTSRAKLLVKQCNTDAEQVLDWMQDQGLPVYCIENAVLAATAVLNTMGYQPGFIPPGQGNTYWLLLQGIGVSKADNRLARDNGLMVLTPKLRKIGFVAHQLFHWLAFQQGIPGYDEKAQQLFRHYFDKDNLTTLPQAMELPVEEIVALRHAVRREIDALCFVRQLSQDVLSANQRHRQLQQQGEMLA